MSAQTLPNALPPAWTLTLFSDTVAIHDERGELRAYGPVPYDSTPLDQIVRDVMAAPTPELLRCHPTLTR